MKPELPAALSAAADQQDMNSRFKLKILVDGLREDISNNDGVMPLQSSVLGIFILQSCGPIEMSMLFAEALAQLALVPVEEK